MSRRGIVVAFVVTAGVLWGGTAAFPDSIHWCPRATLEDSEWWWGKVLRVSREQVVVHFEYGGMGKDYTIHVSRILSIQFDGRYTHPKKFEITSATEARIARRMDNGNLDELRDLDVFSDDLGALLPDGAEPRWQQRRRLKANIVDFDRDKMVFVVRLRLKDKTEVEVADWNWLEYVDRWVR